MAKVERHLPDAEHSTAPPRNVLYRYRWLIALLLIMGLMPSVLTITAQQQTVLNLIHPRLNQALRFGSATTHWWAPLEIRDVELTDLSGPVDDEDSDTQRLLTARLIRTQQPLWKIAFTMGRGTQLVFEQPVVNVRVHDGRSNVEDTLAKLFGDSGASEGTPVSVTIHDGTVRMMSDAAAVKNGSATATAISGINGTYSTLDTRKRMPEIALVAEVGNPDGSRLDASEQGLVADRSINPRIAARLDELAGDFPLIPFSDAQMAALKSDVEGHTLKVRIASPADSDVQHLSVEVRSLKLADMEPLIQRMLPGTVCVGNVSLHLQAHLLDDSDGGGFAGRIRLAGESIGWRNRNWASGESLDLPTVSIRGAVALADDGLLVNDLKVESSLLDLTGNGEVRMAAVDPSKAIAAAAAGDNPERQQLVANAQAAAAGQVQLQGRLDLARLTEMLPRTLQLEDGVSAESGELQFSCRVQQRPEVPSPTELLASRRPGFRWELIAKTSPLKLTRDGRVITIDSPLRLDAIGHLNTLQATIQKARLMGAFGSLSVSPTAFPVDQDVKNTAEAGYAITGTVNPDRLWQDLQQVVDIPRPGLTSDLSVDTKLKLHGDSFTLANLKLQSTDIEVRSSRLTCRPNAPVVQMFDGTLTVNGTAPAFKTLVAPWHAASWLAPDSTVTAKLTADPRQRITMQALIQRNQVMHNASLYRTISSQMTTTDAAVLEIDQGRLEAILVADATSSHFLVETGVIEIPGVSARVTGWLGVEEDALVVNLDADTQYDLQQLTLRLLTTSQQQILFTGTGTDTFHLEGCPGLWTEADVARTRAAFAASGAAAATAPTNLRPLHLTGRISWESGRLYGLPVGAGSAVAELKNGLLRSQPIQCSISSGQVSVMPQWDLLSNRIQLAPGSRIEDLQVTPELSKEWLGYLAPMLADATSVQGTVSARLQQFDYDLNAPANSTIHGELTLRNASSSPGSSLGPLMQLLSLIDRDSGSVTQRLEFPDQNIPFELRNGIVMHDDLQIQFDDYRMVSSGAVGLDRQVQLMLTIPLEKNATTSSSGQTLRIPVGGTIDRPQLDTAGLLQNLGRQQLQNQVDEQLNRGLNKLFDRIR